MEEVEDEAEENVFLTGFFKSVGERDFWVLAFVMVVLFNEQSWTLLCVICLYRKWENNNRNKKL